MIPTTDVSPRKVRRKVSSDGVRAAILAGTELFARKRVLTPILRQFVESDRVRVVSIQDRHDVSPGAERDRRSDSASRPNAGARSAAADRSLGNADVDPVEPFAANLGPGYVLSSTGMALTDGGEIVGETVSEAENRSRKTAVVLGRQLFLDGPRLFHDIARGRTDAIESRAARVGPVMPLIPRYPNYFHWTVECLPRLRALRRYERRTGERVALLVPGDLPGWMRESLHLLGVDDADLVHATAPVYRPSDIVVTEFPEPTPADCRWIRNRVLEASSGDTVSVETGHNVYVSRENAMERRVLNEGEVIETLTEYGFRSYRLEELSVAEQARLFDGANVVVGSHGAGLTNVIYGEDATVVELFGSKVKSNYERLAETCGLKYESLECEATGVDLVVDADRLASIVDAIDT